MTPFTSRSLAAILISVFFAGAAIAQTATTSTPVTPTTKSAPMEKKAEKPRTAISLDCSKQADTKGLHGKERKKFRSACKKDAASNTKAN